MEKYSIFFLQGGLGKHIAATAVARVIKNNYPDRKLIVVCSWPEPFLSLDFIYRVYNVNNTPYFYQDYILDKDSIIFNQEPYNSTNHIHKNTSLIESWTSLFNLQYNGEQPELAFNLKQQYGIFDLWKSDNKILLLQTGGGPFDEKDPYKWTRDMPPGIANQIIEEFKNQYTIFQVTKPAGIIYQNTTVVNDQMLPMNLMTLVVRSSKRVLIDSSLQHGAAALSIPSTVLWIGTDPEVFGYSIHDNIKAPRLDKNFKLVDSTLFNYRLDGISYECPYKSEQEMFNIDEIIKSIYEQPETF